MKAPKPLTRPQVSLLRRAASNAWGIDTPTQANQRWSSWARTVKVLEARGYVKTTWPGVVGRVAKITPEGRDAAARSKLP
jgi:hypothetical protein